jgi:hypothetical protein
MVLGGGREEEPGVDVPEDTGEPDEAEIASLEAALAAEEAAPSREEDGDASAWVPLKVPRRRAPPVVDLADPDQGFPGLKWSQRSSPRRMLMALRAAIMGMRHERLTRYQIGEALPGASLARILSELEPERAFELQAWLKVSVVPLHSKA